MPLSENPNDSLFLSLTKEEFQQWRHHPVTKAYLQFLTDQRTNWQAAAMELWEVGRLASVEGEALRGQVKAFRELENLELESIKSFYGETE